MTSPAATSHLWQRLEALDLDGNAALSFSKRLARDNGWPLGFAQRVVLEYKKFLYLAATCSHPVTPSDEVDQAWHLHLVYTRSYWNELCGEILGFPLHHGPTKGGAAEGQKFTDWYARTIASYQSTFGIRPPADIWPPATRRFGDAPHFRRVNLRTNWLISKPRCSLAGLKRRWPLLVALGVLLVAAGCTVRTPLNPFNWYGPEFLALYWGLWATVYPFSIWLKQRWQGPKTPYHGPMPDLYELARLPAQGQRIANSALATLAHRGQLELLPKQRVHRTTAPGPSHPYEVAVWEITSPEVSRKLESVRKQALHPTLPALRAIDAALEQQGLLLSATKRRRHDRLPRLVALGLLLFGVVKLLTGLLRDRPIGFLLASLLILATVVVPATLKRYAAWTTNQGEQVLANAALLAKQQGANGLRAESLLTLSVALFGVSALRQLGLGPLAELLNSPEDTNSDSGSSGCGSSGCSGCGGGCGGCGGD